MSSRETFYLVEVDCIDPNSLQLTTLRFSTAQDFMTGPRDVPSNTPYRCLVLSVGNFERHCWQRDTTRGRSTVGYGKTVIDNSDHSLDPYKLFGFDGQGFRIYKGALNTSTFPPSYPAYPTGFTLMFAGTMQSASFTWSTLEIMVRDRLAQVYALPIQTVTYGGTNALPNGFDGVASDLQGKFKPILLGAAYNMPVPCVNTSKLTYQITDRTNITIGAVTINAVYDKGVVLTKGSSFATLALLQASTPSASTYNYCDDPTYGAFIQLGSQPAGQLTVDAQEGTTASNTIAQIVTRILTGPGGQPSSQITGAAALDSLQSAQVGKWIDTSGAAIGDIVDELLQGGNCFLTTTRAGLWLFGRLSAPTGPAVLTITADDVKDPTSGITIVQSNDLGTDAPKVDGNTASTAVPLWQVIMNYQLNNQVQSATDIAGSATLTRVGFTLQQYRQVAASNAAVLKVHALAALATFTSLFVALADALAEAQRQLTMRSVFREVVEVLVDPAFAAPVELGSTVALNIARFDWQTIQNIGGGQTQTVGKNFVCIGMAENFGDYSSAGKTTLILWG